MPPPAPSSHFGNGQYSKPLQHIPDDEEGEDVRRRSIAQESGSYSRHYGNGSSYGPQAHGYSSSSHRYQSEAEPPRYDYDNRGWKSSQPPSRPQSPPMHAPSSTSSSSASRPPYSSSQPYSRPQSPEIQPPSWYQHYAHSVTPKGHSDSHYYGHSHHHGSNGNYSSNGYHGAEAMDDEYGHQGDGARLSSKRSKSALNDGQSVHPFDTPELKSSKSKKPKRIKNPGHDEDLILLDNEVYAVKAKRKRANASQLSVLNAAFERSYFPSTEERLRLSKQCRMCPRTVQIWFQNKRQSVKAKSEAMEAAAAVAEGRRASASAVVSSEKVEGGQKRTVDGESDRRRSSGGPGSSSAEAIITALDIQLDGRSVDYFSRKRRATIAKMEQNEQKQRQKQDQIQEEDLSELPSEPQSPSQE
ncbi:hypothetical protein BGX31_008599 [Mortierella sp. GBA43]|nr:hypothetical protein BGX31_008599 [Mortierella sp. GBA43]